MGHRAADILAEHPLINMDGRIKIVSFPIQLFLEAPCPHFFHKKKFLSIWLWAVAIFATAHTIYNLDIKVILFPHLGVDLDGQTKEIDKSCGILLIVYFVFIEGSDLGIV